MDGLVAEVRGWLPIIILGFNVAMFIVIKFNDMKHLEDSLREIKESIKCLVEKEVQHGEKISEIEGRCTATHSKTKKK